MRSDPERYETCTVPIAPLGLFYLQQVIAPEKSPSQRLRATLRAGPAQLDALAIETEAAHRVEQFVPSAARGPRMGSLWQQGREREDRSGNALCHAPFNWGTTRQANRRQRI